MTRFCVIVITHNRRAILLQCLQHLRDQTRPPDQVIVVDSSPLFEPLPSEPGLIHDRFPAGYRQMPKARNRGVELATGDVCAFIDDDCLVEPRWLEELAGVYATRPELAGVGGRIIDRRWTFDPKLPVGRTTSEGRVVANFFGDTGGVQDVEYLPGGNMSFWREWLCRVGGFDPSFVATNHREDPDFCLRLKRRGGALAYQPVAAALHLNARSGELRPWHEAYLRYSFSRNEAYFLSRHFPDQVWRRMRIDLTRQWLSDLRQRSPVGLLCVAVQVFAYLWGVLDHRLHPEPKGCLRGGPADPE